MIQKIKRQAMVVIEWTKKPFQILLGKIKQYYNATFAFLERHDGKILFLFYVIAAITFFVWLDNRESQLIIETKEIVSVDMSDGISGASFLTMGDIDSVRIIYYAEKVGDNKFSIKSVRAKKVLIEESNDITPQIQECKRTKCDFEDEKSYKIIVPVGTLSKEFQKL